MHLDEGCLELGRVLDVAVAELAGAPVVPFHAHAVAAVLGERDHATRATPAPPPAAGHPEGAQVAVVALDVATALVDPAAGMAHLAGRVEVGDLAGHGVGVELAPTLVERGPDGQGDDGAQQVAGLA